MKEGHTDSILNSAIHAWKQGDLSDQEFCHLLDTEPSISQKDNSHILTGLSYLAVGERTEAIRILKDKL